MNIKFQDILEGRTMQALGELRGVMMSKESAKKVNKFVLTVNNAIAKYVEDSNVRYKEYFESNKIEYKQSQFFLVPKTKEKENAGYKELQNKINTGLVEFEWKTQSLNLPQIRPLWSELLEAPGFFRL